MRISGLIGLFKGPSPEAVGPDGRMALSDHFREFRARLLRVMLVFTVALVVALVFRHALLDLVVGPYEAAQATLPEGTTNATTRGAGGGLLLWLKLCGFAAGIVTAPYWLYQIWAFILPGLYAAGAPDEPHLRGRRRTALHLRRGPRLRHAARSRWRC